MEAEQHQGQNMQKIKNKNKKILKRKCRELKVQIVKFEILRLPDSEFCIYF